MNTQEHLNKSIVLCGDCKHWENYAFCGRIVGKGHDDALAYIIRTVDHCDTVLHTDAEFGCTEGVKK